MLDSDTAYAIKRLKKTHAELSEMLKRDYIDESWTKSIEIEFNTIIEELKMNHLDNE